MGRGDRQVCAPQPAWGGGWGWGWGWGAARPLSPRSLPRGPSPRARLGDAHSSGGAEGKGKGEGSAGPEPRTLTPAHAQVGAPASHLPRCKSRPPQGPRRRGRAPCVAGAGSGAGDPQPDSPGGCKTRRRRAPRGRWELCRSFRSWPRREERGSGRLGAPRLCPAAPTARALSAAQGQPSRPTPSRASPHLSSLLPPQRPGSSSCIPHAPSSRPPGLLPLTPTPEHPEWVPVHGGC